MIGYEKTRSHCASIVNSLDCRYLDVMVYGIILELLSPFFFFFSSRRRHTRFDCDWSSDVCSSDLRSASVMSVSTASPSIWWNCGVCVASESGRNTRPGTTMYSGGGCCSMARIRSEERRVGEEWRDRWGACHLKKKKKDEVRVIDEK